MERNQWVKCRIIWWREFAISTMSFIREVLEHSTQPSKNALPNQILAMRSTRLRLQRINLYNKPPTPRSQGWFCLFFFTNLPPAMSAALAFYALFASFSRLFSCKLLFT